MNPDTLVAWLCIIAAVVVPVAARLTRIRQQHRTLFYTSRPETGRYTGRTDQ